MSTLGVALALSGLVPASMAATLAPEAAPPAPAIEPLPLLDSGPLLAWVGTIEEHLSAALEGDEAAHTELRALAIIPPHFRQQLDDVAAAIAGPKGKKVKLRSVAATELHVIATTWFGLVPLKQVDIWLELGAKDARVARAQVAPSPLRLIGNAPEPSWKGELTASITAIIAQFVKAGEQGHCARVPAPVAKSKLRGRPDKTAKAERKALLPRLAGLRKRSCESMEGWTSQRITWRPADLALTVIDKAKRRFTLRQELTHGPKRTLRLYHLSSRAP